MYTCIRKSGVLIFKILENCQVIYTFNHSLLRTFKISMDCDFIKHFPVKSFQSDIYVKVTLFPSEDSVLYAVLHRSILAKKSDQLHLAESET